MNICPFYSLPFIASSGVSPPPRLQATGQMGTAAPRGGGILIQRRQAGRPLANGPCVLQATLGPQRIQPPRDLERAVHADVALEALAVVTDLLDDVVDSPVSYTHLTLPTIY